MKPIIVETKDGKVSITKEDLEQIIKDSYNEGFEKGQKSMIPITTYPVYPNVPTNPIWPNPWEPTVTYNYRGVQTPNCSEQKINNMTNNKGE